MWDIVQYFDKYASQLISIIVCDKFYTRPHLQTKHLTGNELNYFYLIHNGKFNFKDMKLHIQEKVIIVYIYIYIYIYIYLYIYGIVTLTNNGTSCLSFDLAIIEMRTNDLASLMMRP